MHVSQEQRFSQIWDFCRNLVSNKSFHYRTKSVKINDDDDDELFLWHG